MTPHSLRHNPIGGFMKIFKLQENQTNVKTEVMAGFTTFMTMAYIIFVQPQVLGAAGMDQGAVMMATCLAAAVGSILMGLLANFPIGLAPGMGENFFFTYTIVIAMGIPWEKALAIVFISGVFFLILSLLKIRQLVISAVPSCLKFSIAIGIGLFIGLIGLHEAGIVVANPGGLVKLGQIKEPPVTLAIFGLIFTAILIVRQVKGAILIGIVVTAILGLLIGILKFQGLVAMPPSMAPTLMKLDIKGILHHTYIVPIVIFLYMNMFDTIGSLIGVTTQAGIMKNDGHMPRSTQALSADATATTVGALFGTSTVLAYIESVSGVKVGGRTGLVAVVVGLLFLVATFFHPLVAMISGGVKISSGLIIHPVTAPALIIVGSMMMSSITNIDWKDVYEAIPAFLTIVAIPFTYSIADGIAIGFISYPVLKLFGGKGKEVSWLVYVLGILFILRYAFL